MSLDLSPLSLAGILDSRAITAAFQPIVDLDTRDVVAHEALMRGPVGTAWESPMTLLGAAQTPGEFASLDALVRTDALRRFAESQGSGRTVFLNVEPRGLGAALPADIAAREQAAVDKAAELGIRVVVELTERSLLGDPAMLLRVAEQLRARTVRLALDDVGATPESLAFLPLLRPEVVKLDLRLIREHGTLEVAQISNAVRAYAESTGAAIVAEGVETEADHAVALSLGATLGQGWLYGRPGPLPARLVRSAFSTPGAVDTAAGRTPYAVVASARTPRRATKRLLLPLSESLEAASQALAIPPVLFGCFQEARHFTPFTVTRYARLGERLPFVAALGRGMPTAPVVGVRGASLSDDDPLLGEWTVIVLGAHYASALVARDLGDTGAESERRFDYVVTHDRDLVVAAARTLVRRLLPT